MDIFKILARVVTIIPLLLIVTLFMGKRSIGELPVFDFLIILTLGSVVGADIADPNINHFFTFLSIIAIASLQMIVSKMKIKNRKFGRLITFEPTIIIRNGTFMVENLKRIRYSIDNVLQMLREKDVFDVNDVELALIEASGNLSIYKKPSKSTVTLEDVRVEKVSGGIAYPVILEGKVHTNILSQLNIKADWVVQELGKQGLKLEDVFFASVNEKKEIHYSTKNYKESIAPEILH